MWTKILFRSGNNISNKVAERSVNQGRFILIWIGDIRSENIDMSSDKQSEKLCHLKSKVSEGRLILFGLFGP